MSPPIDTWGHGFGYFCANPACQLHVTMDDPRIHGQGQWARVDGVMFDRHPLEVDGPVYCTRCRAAMRNGVSGVTAAD